MIFDDSPSRNLRKYLWGHMIIMFIMTSQAFQFSLGAALMDSPVMSVADYGPWVTGVKAELWSWPLLIASLSYILFMLINGNWRWSPAARMFFATFHVATLTLFAYLSWYVDPIDPFVSGCITLAVCNGWLVVLNAGDLKRAIKGVR